MADLMSLGNMPNMSDSMVSGNSSDNCQLHCYQQYLERALDLFESCSSELQVSRFQKVAQLEIFQVYRSQVCGKKERGGGVTLLCLFSVLFIETIDRLRNDIHRNE